MRLHEIFERQATLFPDADAVQFADEKVLSYQSLNQRANQYARYLEDDCEIIEGDKVLMLIPRGIDQVTILLALSKLGAVYVPLDAECPAGRTQSIIDDISPKCIMTTNELNTFDADTTQVIELFAPENDNNIKGYDSTNLKRKFSINSISYIIYTSGSTGVPKGVPITHSGFQYWFNVISKKFKMDRSRRVLGYISTGFDAHIWEYLMAWVGASSIYLVSDDIRSNINLLKDFIINKKITDATLIPTTLSNMQLEKFLPLSELRSIYSTGEACTSDIIESCERHNVSLWNCYGPTEATFGVSVIECSSDTIDHSGRAPIGYPEDDVKVHIINDAGKLVEGSGTGQLFIESPYLTKGYWNRPTETENHFIHYSFKPDIKVRLYATGDRFFRDELGILRYCGRNGLDAQVKIRGQLVNIYEVESQLKLLDNIRDACVIVTERNNNKFLVAYIQTDDATLSDVDIKTQLSHHLIPAAIPGKLIDIKKLPQTPNGKVDRNALEDIYRSLPSEPYVSILPIEKKLVSMMMDILGVEEITSEDTFFSLGGNSMTLTVLQQKIREKFDVTIPRQEFYKRDLNAHSLVDLFHRNRWNEKPLTPNLINQGKSNKNVFMIHPITGEASTTYSLLAERLSYKLRNNANIYGIDARALSSVIDISLDINSIAEDYANSIQDINKTSQNFLVGWSFGGVLAWKIAEILEARGQHVQLTLIDSICPFLYQRCSYVSYAEILMHLIRNLNQFFCIDIDSIPLLHELEQYSPEQQIKHVFDSLIESNTDFDGLLMSVYLFLLSCQKTDFKKLNTSPLVIRCSETSDIMARMTPVLESEATASLGWSLTDSNIIIRNVMPGTHFDFIHNSKTIDHLTTTLAESFPYLFAPEKSIDNPVVIDKEVLYSMLQETVLKTLELYSEGNLSPPTRESAFSTDFFKTRKEEDMKRDHNTSTESSSSDESVCVLMLNK